MNTSYVKFFSGLMLLVIAQILVGLNIVTSKLILSHMPFLLLLLIRFVLSTILLLPMHWCSKDRSLSIKHHFLQLSRQDWYYLIAQALCAGVLFNLFMMAGLKYTDANVAGIITSALPAIIALFSWKILREKFSIKTLSCISFATIGLLIISFDKVQSLDVNHSFLGDGLIILSLLPEAMYYVLCQVRSIKLPIFLIAAFCNGMNAILLFFILPFIDYSTVSLTINDWMVLFLLGLSSGLFYVCWYLGSQSVSGIMSALSTAVMPIATVLLALVVLDEKLTFIQCVGMSFVLLSIVAYAKR